MNMYLSVFRIRMINGLQYRGSVVGALITRFLWGLMEVLAFSALYRSGHSSFPMEFSQTVSYLWMQQILMVLYSVVFSDNEIYTSISSGSIAYELVRPMDLYGRWFSQACASRLSFTLLNSLPVLVVACILPQPFRMSLPLRPGQWVLFLISAALALFVVAAFAMLMYITLFYTVSQRGIKVIVTAVTTFLSGGIIPLPFFPEPVLAVVKLLPFAAMQNMPLQIYSGTLAGINALGGIVFQLFWLCALVWLGRSLMRRALQKVVVQGG